MASANTIRNLIVRLGVDADHKAANRFDRAVDGIRKTMRRAAMAAGALAGVIGGVLTRGMIKLGMESEASAISIAGVFATLDDAVAPFEERLERANGLMEEFGKRSISSPATRKDFQSIFERAAPALVGMQLDDEEIADFISQSVPAALAFTGGDFEQAGSDLGRMLQGRAGLRLKTFAPLRKRLLEETGTQDVTGFNTLAKQDPRQVLDAINTVLSGMDDVNEAYGASVTGLFASLEEQGDKFQRDIFSQFQSGLQPVLQRTVDWFLRNQRRTEALAQEIGRNLASAILSIESAFVNTSAAVKEFTDEVGGAQTIIDTISASILAIGAMKAIPALVGAAKVLIGVFSLAGIKVIAVVAIFAGLALAIQDVITWMRGGESVTEDLISRFGDADSILQRVKDAFQLVGDTLKSVGREIASAIIPPFQKIWEVIKDIGGLVADLVVPLFSDVMELVKSVGGVVVSVFTLWFKLATWVFGALATLGKWWWDTVLHPILQMIWPIVRSTLKTVLDYFTMVFENIKDVLDFFIRLVYGDFESFGEIVEGALELVKGIFQRAFDFIRDSVVDRIEAIKESIEPIIDWIMDKIDATIGRISDAVDGVKNLGSQIGAGARNLVGDVPLIGGLFGGNEDGAASDAANRSRDRERQAIAMSVGGDTSIEVNARTNADPAEIADEVARRQDDNYQRRLRQAQNSFAAGEL